jgi:hypothetical protein
MSSGMSPDSTNEVVEADAAQPVWDAVRRHLESVKRPIDEEIRNYPPPIPACDAHFNHLLEERSRISRELVRLDTVREESATASEYIRAIDAFIASSPYIDDDVENRIRAEEDSRAR